MVEFYNTELKGVKNDIVNAFRQQGFKEVKISENSVNEKDEELIPDPNVVVEVPANNIDNKIAP